MTDNQKNKIKDSNKSTTKPDDQSCSNKTSAVKTNKLSPTIMRRVSEKSNQIFGDLPSLQAGSHAIITKQALQEEHSILQQDIKDLKSRRHLFPKGRIRISSSNGCPQYYYTGDESRGKEEQSVLRYLRKEDHELARQLAQKGYENKLLSKLELIDQAVTQTLDIYQNINLSGEYKKLHEHRRALVTPRYIQEEEFVRNWENVTWEKKRFANDIPEIYTEKGERVRSKSEKIIADTLERYGIPYRYECPLEFPGETIIYPDFTVLNVRLQKEYFLEHFGRMDEVGYVNSTILKIESMEQHGIFPGKQLLMTFETHDHPINTGVLHSLIREYLI